MFEPNLRIYGFPDFNFTVYGPLVAGAAARDTNLKSEIRAENGGRNVFLAINSQYAGNRVFSLKSNNICPFIRVLGGHRGAIPTSSCDKSGRIRDELSCRPARYQFGLFKYTTKCVCP